MLDDYYLNIEPEDPEGDAFEEWSSEADLTELLDADTINEILWDLYYGRDKDATKQILGVVETLWAGELRSRREYD